jgi:hypothetical protein
VPFFSVVAAVLAGADCAIYAVGGVVFVALGLVLMTGALGVTQAPLWVCLVFAGVGLACLALAVFRIGQVERVLQTGDAYAAEVVHAEAGPARLTGTPWGEPLIGRVGPIAAKGSYRIIGSGETGQYYMQQSWALPLRQGAHIWVLRWDGQDAFYAPN